MPRPKLGEVHDGYRYTGGDPYDKSNWKKVQAKKRTIQLPTFPGQRSGVFVQATPEEEGDVRRARNVGAVASGMAPAVGMAATMAPATAGAALKFAGSPTGGAIIGGVEGARRGGVKGAAIGAVTGAVAPKIVGGAAGKVLSFLARAKPAATETAGAVTELSKHADEVVDLIQKLKNTQKLSNAQVVSVLQEQYGYAAKTARMMLGLVLGGS